MPYCQHWKVANIFFIAALLGAVMSPIETAEKVPGFIR
jgi:hypothetical protein